MQPLQPQALRQPELVTRSDVGPVASRIKAVFAAIVARFSHADHDVTSRLGGHAWTDSLERELNNDIAMCRLLRL